MSYFDLQRSVVTTSRADNHDLDTPVVIISSAQSNGLYPGRGESGTISEIRYTYDSHTVISASWGPLVGNNGGGGTATGGYDITVGRMLREAGYRNIAIINLTAGSTFYNEWMPAEPGAGEGRALLDFFDIALSGLRSQFPGWNTFRFLHIRNQGTTDMRSNNLQYQTGLPSGSLYGGTSVGAGTYPGWSGGADVWHAALQEHLVSASFSPLLPKFCVMNYTGLSSAFFTPAIQRQQVKWVGGPFDAVNTSSIGSHPHLIKTEDSNAFDIDGVHMLSASCTISGTVYRGGGYHWVGTLIAPVLINYLRSQ